MWNGVPAAMAASGSSETHNTAIRGTDDLAISINKLSTILNLAKVCNNVQTI